MVEKPSPSSRPLGRLLKVAVSAGIQSAVRLHILRGDSLEARDEGGQTPLLIAAAKNRGAICSLLLEAGADPFATDLNGRNALALAIAHKSNDAAAVIERFLAQKAAKPEKQVSESTGATSVAETTRPTNQADPAHVTSTKEVLVPDHLGDADTTDLLLATTQECSKKGEQSSGDAIAKSDPDGAVIEARPPEEYEFGDWEPVQRRAPPVNNQSIVQSESKQQYLFDAHAPIDRGASWEDFEAFLPNHAKQIPKAEEFGFQEAVRALLRRVIREGSVPKICVEDVLSERHTGEERDEATESILEFIIGDLGGEIDERQEFHSHVPSENFRVTIADEESPEEESQLDAAMQHLEELRSGSNDPLRIYFKSAGSHALLTHDQEVFIAKEMDEAVESCLDALSTWPEGMQVLLDTLKKSRNDGLAMGRIVVTAAAGTQEDNAGDAIAEDGAGAQAEAPESEPEDDDPGLDVSTASVAEIGPPEEVMPYSDPFEVVDWFIALGKLPDSPEQLSELRMQLGKLRFRRPFLLGLCDRVNDQEDEGAVLYKRAISTLLSARSRMAGSNLRLVLDVARRYLRSGSAIEDLIQDGNFGLLTAVDRFDWRRGFRFSTMATWWIKQSITRGLADKQTAIRLPVHVRERMSIGQREIETAERQRGKPLSVTEQAALCGLPAKRFEAAMRALSEPVSLELSEFDLLPEFDRGEDPFESTARQERNILLDDLLSMLSPKEQKVLRMRYGIGVADEMTLEQVGQRLSLTRERIRQIESRAFKRLHAKQRNSATLALPAKRILDPQVSEKQAQLDEWHSIDQD